MKERERKKESERGDETESPTLYPLLSKVSPEKLKEAQGQKLEKGKQ